MNKTSLRFLAAGGVAGPLLFTLTTIVCAALRPGYSHIAQFISELGSTGTPNAYLMNFAGFIPAGVMIASLGLSLILLLPKRFLTLSGSVLITVFGICTVVVGIFSNDAPGFSGEGSLANRIHDLVSLLMFLCVIIGILMLGISFRRLPSWRRLWLYSLVSALISLVLLIALINSIESLRYTGMWQRLFLLSIFLWMGIVGMHIYRASQENDSAAKVKLK
jgi:hypothetical membrane protein